MKVFRNLSVRVSCCALAMTGLSACATSGPEPAAAPAVTVTVTAPAPVPTQAAPVSEASQAPIPAVAVPAAPVAPEVFTMPAVVGANLQLAQDQLQAVGSFLLDQTDASGLGRMQLVDSNWQVCAQDPAAGAVVSVGTLVTLASVKVGEGCP